MASSCSTCWIQVRDGLLAGGIPARHPQRLAVAVTRRHDAFADPKLQDVLDQIELRAHVELAKLEEMDQQRRLARRSGCTCRMQLLAICTSCQDLPNSLSCSASHDFCSASRIRPVDDPEKSRSPPWHVGAGKCSP